MHDTTGILLVNLVNYYLQQLSLFFQNMVTAINLVTAYARRAMRGPCVILTMTPVVIRPPVFMEIALTLGGVSTPVAVMWDSLDLIVTLTLTNVPFLPASMEQLVK